MIASLFSDFSQYMPHGMCLLWQPWLVILWAGSDILIFSAYFLIPFALLSVLRKRDDIKHRGLVLLFASFILLCGITHILSVVTLWVPIYPILGLVKLATGLVSATTAVVLFKLVPTLVSIPGLDDLERANAQLKAEIAAHKATTDALRQSQADLEQKVEERTAQLREVNAKLSVTAREAVHRSHNLIAVVTAMARQSALAQDDIAEFTRVFTGRLRALADATAAVMNREEKSSAKLVGVVTKQLEPLTLTYPDKVAIDGPDLEIDAEAAQQISLAIHELATNAQKYGGLGTDEARISVIGAVVPGPEGDSRLVLTWQEVLAADIEDNAGSRGFGTKLLTQIIPSMLDGEAERRIASGQLVYELRVPLSAILPDDTRRKSQALARRAFTENFGSA